MIPFKTTTHQVMHIAQIMLCMVDEGIEEEFVVKASDLARTDEGAYDLMALWHECKDSGDKNEVLADLEESLDDYADAPSVPTQLPSIHVVRMEETEHVVASIARGKARLRALVERHGGISAVARKCGMSQPALSRMLGSHAMPRASTLYKIAQGLELSEDEIAGEDGFGRAWFTPGSGGANSDSEPTPSRPEPPAEAALG